jgi:RNA polymerase sigma-70 factor (ECF subfamily)
VDDSTLVEQAARGNVGAYEELVRRYQDVAVRTAYLITGGAAEAEDAAQDAFVKAYYALERFRAGAPFRPWLLRIVANEARNRSKAAERHARLSLRAVKAAPPADAPSPETLVLTGERRTLLLHALDGLREDDRLVIAYRYFCDLSEEEMAIALECARGTVKSRLARALQRLREGIGALDGAGRMADD